MVVGEKECERKLGVREAPGLYISTYGPHCSSCECHDHTNYLRQSQLLMGTGHVVFHALFNSLNHPQVTTDDAAHYVYMLCKIFS